MSHIVRIHEVCVIRGSLVTNKDTVSYLKRAMMLDWWIIYESLAEILATLLHMLGFLCRFTTLLATKIGGTVKFDHRMVGYFEHMFVQRELRVDIIGSIKRLLWGLRS